MSQWTVVSKARHKQKKDCNSASFAAVSSSARSPTQALLSASVRKLRRHLIEVHNSLFFVEFKGLTAFLSFVVCDLSFTAFLIQSCFISIALRFLIRHLLLPLLLCSFLYHLCVMAWVLVKTLELPSISLPCSCYFDENSVIFSKQRYVSVLLMIPYQFPLLKQQFLTSRIPHCVILRQH